MRTCVFRDLYFELHDTERTKYALMRGTLSNLVMIASSSVRSLTLASACGSAGHRKAAASYSFPFFNLVIPTVKLWKLLTLALVIIDGPNGHYNSP